MKNQILRSNHKDKVKDLEKIKEFRNEILKGSTINYLHREKLGDIMI